LRTAGSIFDCNYAKKTKKQSVKLCYVSRFENRIYCNFVKNNA